MQTKLPLHQSQFCLIPFKILISCCFVFVFNWDIGKFYFVHYLAWHESQTKSSIWKWHHHYRPRCGNVVKLFFSQFLFPFLCASVQSSKAIERKSGKPKKKRLSQTQFMKFSTVFTRRVSERIFRTRWRETRSFYKRLEMDLGKGRCIRASSTNLLLKKTVFNFGRKHFCSRLHSTGRCT